MRTNIILATDSYKPSQFKQYPENTTGMFSYVESRGGKFPYTVFIGLQPFIMQYLMTPITQNDIDIAGEIIEAHGEPFNREGWEYILNTHGGYLPLEIKAVPEGTIVPTGNVLVTVENTDPKCAWLTSYIETALLRAIWYPTTIATQSKEIKNIILEYLEKTGTPEDIHFKLHDFGARGVSSPETAGVGGAGHLVNFAGTDTIEALVWLREYYYAPMAGFSIPASEHSSMTSWGRDREKEAYENMIRKNAGKDTIFACVSDSYNIWDAIDMWKELEPLLLEMGGRLVIRPDSGDPVTTPVRVIQKCMKLFGYTINSKGYRVLPDHIRVIQGGGIDIDDVNSILGVLKALEISADNIAFGMGGGLLQKVNRDTQKFAMKCCAAKVDGQWRDVSKCPVDQPDKKSKGGRIALYKDIYGNFITSTESVHKPVMETVYRNGEHLVKVSLEEVRNVAGW
jgi:nicotinamide phosphoribosyltransferase